MNAVQMLECDGGRNFESMMMLMLIKMKVVTAEMLKKGAVRDAGKAINRASEQLERTESACWSRRQGGLAATRRAIESYGREIPHRLLALRCPPIQAARSTQISSFALLGLLISLEVN